jgi:hypothetical protein
MAPAWQPSIQLMPLQVFGIYRDVIRLLIKVLLVHKSPVDLCLRYKFTDNFGKTTLTVNYGLVQ